MPLGLALLVLSAGAVALRPPPGEAVTVALFAQPVTVVEVAVILDAVDGRIVWSNAAGDLWAVAAEAPLAGRLWRSGALAVSGRFSPFACLGWVGVQQ